MSLLYLARSGPGSGTIRPKMFPGQGPYHHVTQQAIPGSGKGKSRALCTGSEHGSLKETDKVHTALEVQSPSSFPMVRLRTGKDHSHWLQKPWEEGTAHSEDLQSFLLCLFHPGTWGSKPPYRFPRILGRNSHNLPWLISPALYSLTYQTLVYPPPQYTYSSRSIPLLCINILLKTQQVNEICKVQEVPEAQEIHRNSRDEFLCVLSSDTADFGLPLLL